MCRGVRTSNFNSKWLIMRNYTDDFAMKIKNCIKKCFTKLTHLWRNSSVLATWPIPKNFGSKALICLNFVTACAEKLPHFIFHHGKLSWARAECFYSINFCTLSPSMDTISVTLCSNWCEVIAPLITLTILSLDKGLCKGIQ